MSRRHAAALAALLLSGCGASADPRTVLTFSGSDVGAEGEVLRRQLARFETLHPDLRVVVRPAPDSADQRHQLYAQWLNAHVGDPDVLQLDVIWVAEFAAAGWVLPLDRLKPDLGDSFPNVLEADRWAGRLFALPWFVDAGMLYWRTDLVPRAPATWAELTELAQEAQRRAKVRYGFVFPAARYEGLTTSYLEILGGFGGQLFDSSGRVAVDSQAGVRALAFMADCLRTGLSPPAILEWQEEQTRFAFQSGDAVFMRNWPYAYVLLQDPASSKVAGRFAVAPMPVEDGHPSTSALGGAQLSVNAFSAHPAEAFALAEYLTRPEQSLERARVASQLPARRSLYSGEEAKALPIPAAEALDIVERAVPRPVSPAYSELSELLQIGLSRALTGQQQPAQAISETAKAMRELQARLGLTPGSKPPAPVGTGILVALIAGLVAAIAWLAARGLARPNHRRRAAGRDTALAWMLMLPALGTILLVALFPLAWTAWESLHLDDLRMPGRGTPFVGLANYLELIESSRFRGAVAHTAFFVVTSVALETGLGLSLALALNRGFLGRALVRAFALVPWAMPTVVVALIWRFLFDSQIGIVNPMLSGIGLASRSLVWVIHPRTAWVPIILADVWKSTPFVALLLLAGLQNIPLELYEAARVDGAGELKQLRYVTLPLLRPAILVAVLFRSLDSLRVFDLIYVLTGGGPGTATEPIALTSFNALLQSLRFGYGSAASMAVFLIALLVALLFIRALKPELARGLD